MGRRSRSRSESRDRYRRRRDSRDNRSRSRDAESMDRSDRRRSRTSETKEQRNSGRRRSADRAPSVGRKAQRSPSLSSSDGSDGYAPVRAKIAQQRLPTLPKRGDGATWLCGICRAMNPGDQTACFQCKNRRGPQTGGRAPAAGPGEEPVEALLSDEILCKNVPPNTPESMVREVVRRLAMECHPVSVTTSASHTTERITVYIRFESVAQAQLVMNAAAGVMFLNGARCRMAYNKARVGVQPVSADAHVSGVKRLIASLGPGKPAPAPAPETDDIEKPSDPKEFISLLQSFHNNYDFLTDAQKRFYEAHKAELLAHDTKAAATAYVPPPPQADAAAPPPDAGISPSKASPPAKAAPTKATTALRNRLTDLKKKRKEKEDAAPPPPPPDDGVSPTATTPTAATPTAGTPRVEEFDFAAFMEKYLSEGGTYEHVTVPEDYAKARLNRFKQRRFTEAAT